MQAACRVIAERGADATRFAHVAAESGVPVSTLQYYFGSREDPAGAVQDVMAVLRALLRPAGDPT